MRICVIGDSFVNGTGDKDCLGWAGRICSAARHGGCDVTLYNLGIRGDTSAQIAERWRRETRARLPPAEEGRLIFSFGVNDCVTEAGGEPRIAEPVALANARIILREASLWLPTLMIGPPPTADAALNARVERLSEGLRSVCDALGVPFLSVWNALIASEIWMGEVSAGDGAHPNNDGYSLFAELIAQWPPWRAWIERKIGSSERA